MSNDILPNIKNQIGFWIEYENYWLYNAPQRSQDWLNVRLGRPSGSTFASCVGDSQYCGALQRAKYICGIEKEQFSDFTIKIMGHGTEYEPIARNFYYNKYYQNTGYKVLEVGYVIPKWNYNLGVSVDGIVLDNNDNTVGIIEIKCPVKMYPKLYGERNGTNDHIKLEHYQQMHLGMAIMGVNWCDYVVFSTSDNDCYIERVYFDKSYWDDIYNRIKNFIEVLIKPMLGDKKIINPPY